MKLGRWLWAGILAAGAFAVGYGALKGDEGPAVDQELFELANRGHGQTSDSLFDGVTELGSFYASGAAAGVLFATGRRSAAVRALSACGATWLLLQGV
ncbi:MAG: hypothetical protein ACXVWF_05350, partial [Actinomycetota bacterium]